MAKRHVYTDIPVHKTQSFGKHEDSVRAGRQIQLQIQIQPPLPGRLPVPLYLCLCNRQLEKGNWQLGTGLLLAVSSSSGRRMDDVPTVTGFLMMAPNTLNKSIMLFHPHRPGNTIPGIVTTSGPAIGAWVFGHRGSSDYNSNSISNVPSSQRAPIKRIILRASAPSIRSHWEVRFLPIKPGSRGLCGWGFLCVPVDRIGHRYILM